jgi:glucuronate isomerase
MLLDPLAQELYTELGRVPVIDTHTHVDPRQPTARNLDDLLTYHHYPELALATGMDRAMLGPGVDPEDRVRALLYHLIDFFPNTAPRQWFTEIARAFLGFQGERLVFADCTTLYDAAERLMRGPDWERRVLETCNLEKVFVNNAFDDPLEGFDSARYVPCLAADELVFHLDRPEVRERLARVTGLDAADAGSLREALASRFEYFGRRGARAVTVVLPPHFAPLPVPEGDFARGLAAVAGGKGGTSPAGDDGARLACAHGVFRAVVEQCAAFHLPLQLMVGMSYRAFLRGGPRPPDLFDHRTPLLQYADLFREFPSVTFCVAPISAGPSEELAHLSKALPNVMTSGHGGDVNDVPAALEQTIRCRLQAVPQTKQIGYYTAMDRLEFALPQFNMYRRILAHVLASDFIRPRIYTVGQALGLGRLLLRDNARRVFDV